MVPHEILQQLWHSPAAQGKKVRKRPMRFGKDHQLIAHSSAQLLIATTDFLLTIGEFSA